MGVGSFPDTLSKWLACIVFSSSRQASKGRDMGQAEDGTDDTERGRREEREREREGMETPVYDSAAMAASVLEMEPARPLFSSRYLIAIGTISVRFRSGPNTSMNRPRRSPSSRISRSPAR